MDSFLEVVEFLQRVLPSSIFLSQLVEVLAQISMVQNSESRESFPSVANEAECRELVLLRCCSQLMVLEYALVVLVVHLAEEQKPSSKIQTRVGVQVVERGWQNFDVTLAGLELEPTDDVLHLLRVSAMFFENLCIF